MDYHLERANVLNGNIANIDTPGFRPLDVVRPEQTDFKSTLALTGTNATHLAPPGGMIQAPYIAENRVVNTGADGNAVSLEREMAEMSTNNLAYESVSRFVTAHLGILRYVAGDANG